jgi:hypothetical protein
MRIIPAYARASSSFIALMLFGAECEFFAEILHEPNTLKSPAQKAIMIRDQTNYDIFFSSPLRQMDGDRWKIRCLSSWADNKIPSLLSNVINRFSIMQKPSGRWPPHRGHVHFRITTS